MTLIVQIFAILYILINITDCGVFSNGLRLTNEPVIGGNPGEVLFLTPLIEEGKISEAQTLAQVHHPIFQNVTSYSGYLTVNKNYNSNTFIWFFPAEIDYKNAPVVLWLQGGPGASSLFALFSENGPFILETKDKVRRREHRWCRQFSVLYIDNPIGTGFSFTNSQGFARNETQVGKELYEALQQFFKLFPELQKNDFILTGESYAGKYVPAIGYTIMKRNSNAELKINLKGLAIGNGWIDPENQLEYADYLYQIGLIDSNSRKIMKQQQELGKLVIFQVYNFRY